MDLSRIAASTMTCRLFTYEGALMQFQRLGIHQAELCPVKSWVPHFDAYSATEDSMNEMARMAQEHEVRFVSINGWHGLPDRGPYTAESILRTVNTMRLAAKLGARIVTGNCGDIGPGDDRAQRLKDVAAYQKLAAEIAEDHGIQYCIEAPHKNSLAVHKDEIREYWDAMDPRIKMTYDPAHLMCEGEDPAEILSAYVDRVAQVHLRDAVPGNSLLHYGDGQIDFKQLMSILEKAGYTGYFSMEFPVNDLSTFDTRMKASVEYLKSL